MKVIVIVPLIITVEAPGNALGDLYDGDKALRREELLDLALAKLQAGADVEMPDPDNEGVIFLDEKEDELADELDDPEHARGFKT
jgi:hypothetical protein